MPDLVAGRSAAEMPPLEAAQQSSACADHHLVIAGVSKRFGGVSALQDVSLSLRPGEIVSIIGPNGAGKSSLLNTISGFYRPDTGRITMGTVDITVARPSKIAALGIARTFQNIALFTGLTVLENVMLGRHIHMTAGVLAGAFYWGRAQREEIKNRKYADEILALLGLSHLRGKMSGDLAYGLRKRVELARALLLEPRILLLDEPMGGMNQDEKHAMKRFICDVNKDRGTTIVLIEHDIGVVMDISDRVVVLDRGRTIAEDTPAQVQRDPVVVRAYLGTRRVRGANRG